MSHFRANRINTQKGPPLQLEHQSQLGQHYMSGSPQITDQKLPARHVSKVNIYGAWTKIYFDKPAHLCLPFKIISAAEGP